VVVLCSLVLLAALTIALSGYSWKKGGRKLEIEFHDATGIKPRSSVKFAGKTAGSVAAIRYLGLAERTAAKDHMNAVRITLLLNDDVPPLPSDLTAQLQAETLLGEKFIALTPGRPDAPPLPEGTIVQGGEPSSIDGLMRSSQATIDSVNEILTRFKSDYPGLVPRLAELISQANSILAQGSNLVRNVDSAVLSASDGVTQLKADYTNSVPKLSALLEQAKRIAANADLAITNVNTLVQRVDGVVSSNQEDLARIVNELRVVSQNLKVISTYTKALTATLAEKPSTLIWSRKKNVLPSEQTILNSSEPIATEKLGDR
jgi:phospholipid/cholesterol/gamma-HCH transport system substrate-binding protein